MTFSQEQSQPSSDAPTLRIQPVATPRPKPRSTIRRIARRIVGPTLLTKKS